MQLEKGQKLKHKKSGRVVEFEGLSRAYRGVVKINTTGPWGPINLDEFDPIPSWTLSISPESYIDRYGREAKNSALALEILGV